MCGRTQVWSHIIHWQACCIEIQSNLRRTKLHRVNQGSNFLGDTFSNRDNVRAPIQFRWESQPIILKDDFSSKIDPSTFISIAPALLDWSNATSWVFSALKSTSHFPSPQCLVDQIQVQKPILVVATGGVTTRIGFWTSIWSTKHRLDGWSHLK